MKNQRLWQYGVATAACLALAAGLHPRLYVNENSSPSFWARKMRWRGQFDMVLAGDSRVYQGLSPAIMARHLPARRIGNFGFKGTGYGEEYLARLPQLLDPRSSQRAIVLGVSPGSLTEASATRNGFLEWHRMTPLEVWNASQPESVAYFFAPYTIDDLSALLRGRKPRLPAPRVVVRETYHTDGWVACSAIRENPREALEGYRMRLEPVSETVTNRLVGAIPNWTDAGIRVYAFRPPTTAEMAALEEERSGFDEEQVAGRISDAGGVWITIANGNYRSYDGSHLSDDGARRLSQDLALAIAACE